MSIVVSIYIDTIYCLDTREYSVYLCVPYSTYTFMVVQLYIIIYIINARRFEIQQILDLQRVSNLHCII